MHQGVYAAGRGLYEVSERGEVFGQRGEVRARRSGAGPGHGGHDRRVNFDRVSPNGTSAGRRDGIIALSRAGCSVERPRACASPLYSQRFTVVVCPRRRSFAMTPLSGRVYTSGAAE